MPIDCGQPRTVGTKLSNSINTGPVIDSARREMGVKRGTLWSATVTQPQLGSSSRRGADDLGTLHLPGGYQGQARTPPEIGLWSRSIGGRGNASCHRVVVDGGWGDSGRRRRSGAGVEALRQSQSQIRPANHGTKRVSFEQRQGLSGGCALCRYFSSRDADTAGTTTPYRSPAVSPVDNAPSAQSDTSPTRCDDDEK